MTESRSHLAGTTPFQNRIPVRLLAPQHVKGRLGQMARHCSNGFVVSLALAQTVIELADVPLRTAPVIDGHRVGGLHKRPLQIAVDRKSTRLNSSHGYISYAVFCLKKKRNT